MVKNQNYARQKYLIIVSRGKSSEIFEIFTILLEIQINTLAKKS